MAWPCTPCEGTPRRLGCEASLREEVIRDRRKEIKPEPAGHVVPLDELRVQDHLHLVVVVDGAEVDADVADERCIDAKVCSRDRRHSSLSIWMGEEQASPMLGALLLVGIQYRGQVAAANREQYGQYACRQAAFQSRARQGYKLHCTAHMIQHACEVL